MVVLDEAFDDGDSLYEAAIVQRCLDGKTIEPGPDFMGVHDGIWCNSDSFLPEGNKRKIEKIFWVAQTNELLGVAIFDAVMSFEHGANSIAKITAADWISVGERDANRRGITRDEWIWKRSRFLAGFK